MTGIKNRYSLWKTDLGQWICRRPSTIQDGYRIEYLREHIKAMIDAVDIDGVELLGYTAWGCIDLVSESTRQMSKRYVFIYVDVDDYGKGTFKRIKKDSFDYYRQVIESNGENLEY